MSKKHHGGPAPVPPENRPKIGPTPTSGTDDAAPPPNADETGAPFSDQDEKRRLGGFETAGEHAIQQPSKRNDGA